MLGVFYTYNSLQQKQGKRINRQRISEDQQSVVYPVCSIGLAQQLNFHDFFCNLLHIGCIYRDKAHHTGANHVFNGCVPNSVQAIVGVIKSAVRHGFCLQGS